MKTHDIHLHFGDGVSIFLDLSKKTAVIHPRGDLEKAGTLACTIRTEEHQGVSSVVRTDPAPRARKPLLLLRHPNGIDLNVPISEAEAARIKAAEPR